MDEGGFWRLIGRAQGDPEALEGLLGALPPADITAFQAHFDHRLAESYRWDLWAAADIIMAGCGDDSFDYFRAWLIGQGEETFRAVLEDPDALAEFADQDPELFDNEALLYAAANAYLQKTGQNLEDAYRTPPAVLKALEEPAGTQIDEDDAESRFPKIFAAFA